MSKQTVLISVLGDTKPFAKAMEGVGGSLKGFGIAAGAALVGTGAAIVGLTAAATKAYGEYEQLSGGVTKLFGEADAAVERFAKNAAQTAGLSTNQYLSTVTSFSASLISGLGGDQAAAAKIADQAITDMADNANTFGTALGDIQNAYNGFAKGNFTMLDNLKLGYGGTASEMARLINDSGVMGAGFEATAETMKNIPFDKMIEGINVIQTGMNITGTTAREAATTIEGSFLATKASLDNFVLGFGQTDADFEELTNNLVQNATNLVNNIIPVVGRVAAAIPVMIPALIEAISDVLPELLPVAAEVIMALVDGIVGAAPKIVDAAIPVVLSLVGSIVAALPKVLEAGLAIILALVNGITKALPSLIPIAVKALLGLTTALIDSLPLLLDAGLAMILALAQGLIDALPKLLQKLPEIITSIISFLVSAIPTLLEAGIGLFMALVGAIPEIIPPLIDAIIGLIPVLIETVLLLLPELFTASVDLFMAIVDALPVVIPTLITALIGMMPKIIKALVDAGPKLWDAAVRLFTKITDAGNSIGPRLLQAGRDLVQGLWNGVTGMWNDFMRWWERNVGGIVKTVKDVLGIRSPSRVFASIGRDVVRGLENGLSATNGIDRIMSGLSAQMAGGFEAQLATPNGYAASGGNSYTIVLPVGMPSAAAGREIVRAIDEYERLGGRRG